jgi:predicted Fe-Mo cluster-binding NifX family protein
VHIVCIPVEDDRGLRAPVARGLDAAPVLLLVDATTLAFRAVSNGPLRRQARGCDPCEPLDDVPVDAVIVASIEAGALARLSRRRLSIYLGAFGTAATALADFLSGRLRSLAAEPDGDPRDVAGPPDVTTGPLRAR